jgi:hypothetical protein
MKPRPSGDDNRWTRLLAVAQLVTMGCSTPAIAQMLGLGESTVRRLRMEAKALRLYTVDWSLAPNPTFKEKAYQLIHRSDMFEALRPLSHNRLKGYYCVVLDPAGALEEPADAEAYLSRLRAFAKGATPHLVHALTNARITLVTYGRTLQCAFEALNPNKLDRDFWAYPACCDPYEYHREPWSSSRLAKSITQRQGRPADEHPSLAKLLPIIGPHHGPQGTRALADFVEHAPGYITIYGPGGLAEQANCLVTSHGRKEQPWTMGEDHFVKAFGIKREELHPLIAAEIGSVLLPKPDLTPAQMQRFEQITGARLGLKLRHLESLAALAAGTPAPGVVLIAMGANKAASFLELVRRGLINIAIVDNSLEARLRELLNGQFKKAA